MKIYVNWRSALKAIKKNKKRSILTMFGIVIGIAAVIAILSIGRGFERDTIKSLTNSDSDEVTVEMYFTPTGEMMSQANIDFFNDSDLMHLEDVDGIKKAEYMTNDSNTSYIDVQVQDKKENKQLETVTSTDKETLYGRNLTSYDNATSNKVVMMDSVTAKAMFGSAKAAVGQGFEYQGQLFEIVGIFEGSEQVSMFSMPETNILLPKQSYETFTEPAQDQTAVVLTLESGTAPGEITTKAVDEMKANGSRRDLGSYEVFDTALLTEGIGEMLQTITLFISAVAGISLFIAGVGVMNMMYISVSERIREIGIRRAMGATRGAIRTQFLLEGMTLTLIGGIIGYILGMILAYVIGGVMDISITIDLFTVLLAVGVSSGIGLVFSVMPASEAAKKDLIDILR